MRQRAPGTSARSFRGRVGWARVSLEYRQFDAGSGCRLVATTAELAPGPVQRVVVGVRDPFLERDDRVIGDLDVLRRELGAALGDVAVADPAAVLEVFAP